MIAYITKYALMQGIIEVEAIPVTSNGRVVMIGFDLPGYCRQYCFPTHSHETKAAAITKAEAMRAKEIARLKAKLAKLEKLSFT